ncbi:MAG: hypothetical protein JXB24_05515 [Bacteroidales bacterium]|nr:hypothetical protein [Bacteroidales bacterium]
MSQKVIPIAFFIISFLEINAQQLQFVHPDNKHIYCTGYEDQYMTRINSRSDLSDSINAIVNKHLKTKTKEHYRNFTFVDGCIYDLNRYMSDHPDKIYKNDFPLPKYGFTFLWRDTTLGISKQYVTLTLDQLGQAVYFSFPNMTHFEDVKFVSLDKAKVIADSLVRSDSFKFEEFNCFLVYDRSTSLLEWVLWYSRHLEKDKLITCEVCVPLPENYQYTQSIQTFYLADTGVIEEDIMPVVKTDSTGHNSNDR